MQLRVPAFLSRACTEQDSSYHSFTGEAATGRWAFPKQKFFLISRLFTWLTDCSGLSKFFNDDKGFGFISEEGSEKEYFVHVSGLMDDVREGDEVEFELQEGKKGLNAVNVKRTR